MITSGDIGISSRSVDIVMICDNIVFINVSQIVIVTFPTATECWT